MTKVLMFGWEFPPHISGGLGTACHGLSQALLEENVSILFVVPRKHGDESIPLISASDIVMNVPTREGSMSTNTLGWEKESLEKERFLHVDIPSSLPPTPELPCRN